MLDFDMFNVYNKILVEDSPFLSELHQTEELTSLLSLVDKNYFSAKEEMLEMIETTLAKLSYEDGKDFIILLIYFSNLENYKVIKYLFCNLYAGIVETVMFFCKVYSSKTKSFFILEDTDEEKNNRLLIDDIEKVGWLSPRDFIYKLAKIEEKLISDEKMFH